MYEEAKSTMPTARVMEPESICAVLGRTLDDARELNCILAGILRGLSKKEAAEDPPTDNPCCMEDDVNMIRRHVLESETLARIIAERLGF